jgi:hypothetical protein
MPDFQVHVRIIGFHRSDENKSPRSWICGSYDRRMRSCRRLPGTALALALTLVLRAADAIQLGVDISVLASMPPRQLLAMKREAAGLWEPHGVALTWIGTTDAGRQAPPGLLALLHVRLADSEDRRHPGRFSARRLGTVLFLENGGVAEPTVSLSIEAIGRTIEEARWTSGRVGNWPAELRQELLGRALGRVLAHEIGHFVLAWRGHTPDGLMRPDFRGETLVQPGRRGFELSDRLMPRLRARLAQLSSSGGSAALAR